MNHTNTIRNISREIKRECFRNNIYAPESFIYYYVRLLYLNPKYGISANILSNRDAVVAFVKMVVDQLKYQNTPQFITLKIQWSFKANYKTREELIQLENDKRMERLHVLKHLIMKKVELLNEHEMLAYRKKISAYSTLSYGLGNPLKEGVFQEGYYALKSIMDDSEIREFAQLPLGEKEEQLDYTAKLICGIRLFNKETDKGGEGIPDLHEVLLVNKSSLHQTLQLMIKNVEEKINKLTMILNESFKFKKNDYMRTELKFQAPHPLLTKDKAEYLRDLLVAYRQYQTYCYELFSVLDHDRLKLNKLHYITNWQIIYNICSDRVAVASSKVFPLFEKAAELWKECQHEGMYLLHINEIMKMIRQFVSAPNYPEELIEMCVGPSIVREDVDWVTKKITHPYTTEQPPNILHVNSYSEIVEANEKLSFHGYDVFKLVYTEGVLIPGSFEGGVAVFNSTWNFVFSEYQSYTGWCEDLVENILRGLDMVRNRVYFIEMFGLSPIIEMLMEKEIIFDTSPKKKTGHSLHTQTEDHIMMGYIDPNYTWNIWDLKRDALQKAKLTHCLTVSTQTEPVYSKWSIPVQTLEPEDNVVTTKTDNYVNVSKPSRFLYGLRGQTDDKFIDMDLTRPIHKVEKCIRDNDNQ